tara:strand:- start:1745 stop:1885 length:141 start_codon:yes stop_codon:yes gene_type:complete
MKGVNSLDDLEIDTRKGDVHITWAKTRVIVEDPVRSFDPESDILFG